MATDNLELFCEDYCCTEYNRAYTAAYMRTLEDKNLAVRTEEEALNCAAFFQQYVMDYVNSKQFSENLLNKIYPGIVVMVVVMSFLIIVSLLVLLNLMLVGLGFKPLRAYLCWDCFTQEDLEERKEVKKKIEAVLLECKDCQKEKNEAGENGRNKTEEYKKEDENMSDELKKNKDDIQIMEAQGNKLDGNQIKKDKGPTENQEKTVNTKITRDLVMNGDQGKIKDQVLTEDQVFTEDQVKTNNKEKTEDQEKNTVQMKIEEQETTKDQLKTEAPLMTKDQVKIEGQGKKTVDQEKNEDQVKTENQEKTEDQKNPEDKKTTEDQLNIRNDKMETNEDSKMNKREDLNRSS